VTAAIFGLAHLLGIQLQPRIRNWSSTSVGEPSWDAAERLVEHFQNAGLAIDIAEACGSASQTQFSPDFNKSSEKLQDSIVATFCRAFCKNGFF
jgi:Tn3 transposase DDE domain